MDGVPCLLEGRQEFRKILLRVQRWDDDADVYWSTSDERPYSKSKLWRACCLYDRVSVLHPMGGTREIYQCALLLT